MQNAQQIARAMEAVEIRAKKMESLSTEQVNHIQMKQKYSSQNGGLPTCKRCFHCGREGHYARDTNCPARSATCKKCKNVGHFVAVCKLNM